MRERADTAGNALAQQYRIPVYRVQLVRECAQATTVRHIGAPTDAALIVQQYLGDVDREHFVALLLDTKHKVIGINTVSIGTLDSAPVHPREVFKPAIAVSAAAVIVAHNHPSGAVDPSLDDREMTARLDQAGDILGIPVLDSLIVATDSPALSSARRDGWWR